MKKDPSSDGKPETEETVHEQQPPSGPDHLVPMELNGCKGEWDSASPVYSHHADSQSSARAMEDDEKDHQHHQMAHEELLMMNNSSASSCTSPPPWLIHDAHLGTNCSALQFMQMQSDDADYYLPELLEYGGSYDNLLERRGELQDISGVDGRTDIFNASVDHSIRLGALYWNYGSNDKKCR